MKNYKLKNCLFGMLGILIFGITKADIMEYVNPVIKPQDDFVMHANGLWINTINSLPKDQICARNSKQQALQVLRNGILEKCESPIVNIMIASMQNANSKGEEEIAKNLNLIGNIKSKTEIPGLIANLKQMGVVTFVDIFTILDKTNPQELLLAVVGAPKKQSTPPVLSPKKMEVVNQIQDSLNSINPSNDSLPRSKQDLLQSSWKDFFINSQLKSEEIFLQKDYFSELQQKVINKYSLEDLKLYFQARFLEKYGEIGSGDFNKFSQVNKVDIIEKIFNKDLTELCFKKYIDKTKPKIVNIFNQVRTSYDKDINSNWMSEKTKLLARGKLNRIPMVIGYSDQGANYSGLELNVQSPVQNTIDISKRQYQHFLDGIGKSGKDAWLYRVFSLNAEDDNGSALLYIPEKNTIIVRIYALFPPYFYIDGEDAVNYGAIGTIIGHEIFHAFDEVGMQYNTYGQNVTWATYEDKKNLNAKLKLLSEQYAAYHSKSVMSVNEDAADNAGLNEAGDAYIQTLKDKPEPAIINYTKNGKQIFQTTGMQRFYYSYAELMRNSNICFESASHSNALVRINAVKNQPGFYKAFAVESGDRVYLEPKKRINIW